MSRNTALCRATGMAYIPPRRFRVLRAIGEAIDNARRALRPRRRAPFRNPPRYLGRQGRIAIALMIAAVAVGAGLAAFT